MNEEEDYIENYSDYESELKYELKLGDATIHGDDLKTGIWYYINDIQVINFLRQYTTSLIKDKIFIKFFGSFSNTYVEVNIRNNNLQFKDTNYLNLYSSNIRENVKAIKIDNDDNLLLYIESLVANNTKINQKLYLNYCNEISKIKKEINYPIIKKVMDYFFQEDWDFVENTQDYWNYALPNNAKFGIVVRFNDFRIRNKYNKSHNIRGLYTVLPLDFRFKAQFGISGIRMIKTIEEINCEYEHSHLQGESAVDKPKAFCLGDPSNPICDTVIKLQNGVTEDLLESYCINLISMVHYESYEGTPYRYIKNISPSVFETVNNDSYSKSNALLLKQNDFKLSFSDSKSSPIEISKIDTTGLKLYPMKDGIAIKPLYSNSNDKVNYFKSASKLIFRNNDIEREVINEEFDITKLDLGIHHKTKENFETLVTNEINKILVES